MGGIYGYSLYIPYIFGIYPYIYMTEISMDMLYILHIYFLNMFHVLSLLIGCGRVCCGEGLWEGEFWSSLKIFMHLCGSALSNEI